MLDVGGGVMPLASFSRDTSVARESVAFRASLLPQPAPLLQMAHATLKAAPRPTFDPALFEALERRRLSI